MGDNGDNCGNVNVKGTTNVVLLVLSFVSLVLSYASNGRFCVVLSMDLLFLVLQ